jgi:DNA-binding PadR family transcriptional regulator
VSTAIFSLGYALLGLLQQKPSSGYDLRKNFLSTSMKTYSDSPGAIYPALRRLQREQLIRGTIEETSALRRRQIFHLTPKGVDALQRWITRPVTREELVGGKDQIMLRFAFSEPAVGPIASLELLKSLQAALLPHIQNLRKELQASQSTMPTSGRLAFEGGIRGTECLLQWTQDAITKYAKERKRGSLCNSPTH